MRKLAPIAITILLAVDVSGQPNETSGKKADSATNKPPATSTKTVEDKDGSRKTSGDPTTDSPNWYAPLERPDWWLVIIAALTGGAIAYQAREMTRTTSVMENQLRAIERQAGLMDTQIQDSRTSSDDNAKNVRASIAEATRSAGAMEGVASLMAVSVGSVKESIVINREIADRQKFVTEIQSRAYLAVTYSGVIPQNPDTEYRYEPTAKIINRGNTPAHDIRFSMQAAIIKLPLEPEFAFPIPDPLQGHSSMIAPSLEKIIRAAVPKFLSEDEAKEIREGISKRIVVWGIVKYRDVFGSERYTRFGFTCLGVGKKGDDTSMSRDTAGNNDAD